MKRLWYEYEIVQWYTLIGLRITEIARVGQPRIYNRYRTHLIDILFPAINCPLLSLTEHPLNLRTSLNFLFPFPFFLLHVFVKPGLFPELWLRKWLAGIFSAELLPPTVCFLWLAGNLAEPFCRELLHSSFWPAGSQSVRMSLPLANSVLTSYCDRDLLTFGRDYLRHVNLTPEVSPIN